MSGTEVNRDCWRAKASWENPLFKPPLRPGNGTNSHGHSGSIISGISVRDASQPAAHPSPNIPATAPLPRSAF